MQRGSLHCWFWTGLLILSNIHIYSSENMFILSTSWCRTEVWGRGQHWAPLRSTHLHCGCGEDHVSDVEWARLASRIPLQAVEAERASSDSYIWLMWQSLMPLTEMGKAGGIWVNGDKEVGSKTIGLYLDITVFKCKIDVKGGVGSGPAAQGRLFQSGLSRLGENPWRECC